MPALLRIHPVLALTTGLLSVALLGAVAWFVLKPVSQDAAPAPASMVAPDFTLRDVHGLSVTLSETAGTVRVLTFWASWSPYSRSELRVLDALTQEYGAEVTFLAIGRDTTQRDGERFLTELGLEDAPWALFDPADSYYRNVGGYNMPETAVLGKDGRILFHIHGPVTEEALRAAIDNALTTP